MQGTANGSLVDTARASSSLWPPPKPVASAYERPLQEAKKRKFVAWKVWLVLGDCCLIGLQPVLVHLSKGGKEGYSYHPVSINFLVEVAKTIFAILVILTYGTGRPGVPMYRSMRSFFRDAYLNKSLMVPAGLYAINNYLKFLMQLYFKPTTAKMLGNLKVLVIAVLMKLVLRRTFNLFQWEALLLLVAGITINHLDRCTEDSSVPLAQAAILCTAAAILVPSLASTFNEWALKRHMETSVHLQNFFLYFFGLAFNTLGLLTVMALTARSWSSIFQGHSKTTMLLVINNALQGILSSFFFKYADTILKKFSSTLATIFTGLMSAVLFGHKLTLNFALGIGIVFISMHIFFSHGGLKQKVGGNSPAKSLHKDDGPPESRHMVSADSTQSLISLEANMSDPDNMHLSARRTSLLPK